MTRITLGDLLTKTRIPAALNQCPEDEVVVDYINEAIRRLIDQQQSWGMVARYKCTATSGRIVFPKQVASIVSLAVCSQPVKIRNSFFEWQGFGVGIQSANNATMQALTYDEDALFYPLQGTYPVGVYCDLADDIGTEILLLGYDLNGQWVRTKQGGVWQDGEIVAASNTNTYGALSNTVWSSITGIQKPRTNGTIRYYSYDSGTSTQLNLVWHEYDETNPVYRIFYVPALDTSASSSKPITIEAMVRMEFSPMVEPTDYCLINCIPAIKDMACAVKEAEGQPTMSGKVQALNAGIMLAKAALEGEYRRYNGRQDKQISVSGTAGPTERPICNLI